MRAAILGLAVGLSVLAAAAPACAADESAIEQPAAEEVAAFIDVAGAPGDGEQALELALSNRLLNEGFAVTGTPQVNAYEIQGTVRMLPAKRGKENIRIDWTIFGPEGTRIGNVTQIKEIRKGSLDRHWGAAADAAADAAARDILKLLPQ
ncbi:MAG TPA: hypothetical protein VMW57_04825 [Methyloceanibacter sp.]|nr:hypothetical protein [Methyloceanibacter sp.]